MRPGREEEAGLWHLIFRLDSDIGLNMAREGGRHGMILKKVLDRGDPEVGSCLVLYK